SSGMNQKMIVEGGGKRFLFKPKGQTLIFDTLYESDVAAMNLRRAGDEPTIPIVDQRVKMPDGRVIEGYVKPFVEGSKELGTVPGEWTPTQTSQVLVDAAWAEWLGNGDTKPSNTLSFQPEGAPELGGINIDWDLTFIDYKKNIGLSRFKRSWMESTAESFL